MFTIKNNKKVILRLISFILVMVISMPVSSFAVDSTSTSTLAVQSLLNPIVVLNKEKGQHTITDDGDHGWEVGSAMCYPAGCDFSMGERNADY